MKPLEHRYRDKRKRKPFEPKPAASASVKPASTIKPPAASATPSSANPSITGVTSGATPGATPGADSRSTHWGGVAGWYDHLVGDGGSEYHQKVVLPGVMRMLAPGPADIALDIACGQGVLCRKLREKGAKVVGVDAAGELIRLAQARGDEGIEYQVMDARDLSRLPEARFTSATCLLAIQNIDPLPPMFEGVARALRERGRFVLVMMHPCFRVPRQAHWGFDEQARVQYRRVDRYMLPFKQSIIVHPGQSPVPGQPREQIWSFHRPLQTYINALGKAGLPVEHMEEWTSHKRSDPGPKAAAEDKARSEIPMFLALRAVKAAR